MHVNGFQIVPPEHVTYVVEQSLVLLYCVLHFHPCKPNALDDSV